MSEKKVPTPISLVPIFIAFYMGPKTLCKLHQRYNLDNTYTLEINKN